MRLAFSGSRKRASDAMSTDAFGRANLAVVTRLADAELAKNTKAFFEAKRRGGNGVSPAEPSSIGQIEPVCDKEAMHPFPANALGLYFVRYPAWRVLPHSDQG